jgi:uridine kinase
MTYLDLTELGRRITTSTCLHPVRIVAIDGLAGAGKSRLARRLAEHLGDAPIVPMDDFLAWDDITTFVPRLEAQVVAPLLRGESIRYQQRDWTHDWAGRSLGPWRQIPFSPIVIFEGVSSARREISTKLSYAIWVETPSALCVQRGIERDGEGARALWEGFTPGLQRFFAEDGTRERADLVVDGQVPFDDATGISVLREGPEPQGT